MINPDKMKISKYYTLLLCFFLIQLTSFKSISQTSILWENSYGGSKSDVGTSIAATYDGGYIMVGSTESEDGDITNHIGYYDYWIVKIDSNGSIEWDKTYGGSASDRAMSVVQANDSGYVIAGFTSSHDGDVIGNNSINMLDFTDYWVIKINTSGNVVWKKCFGGSEYEQSTEIIKDINGDFLIVGTALSSDGDINDHHGDGDIWVVKINNSGNVIWKKSYGGTGLEQGWTIANTNNGYVIAGSSNTINGDVTASYGSADAWVVRIDYSGNIIWQKSYGGSNSDQAYSVVQDNAGNFYVACNSESSDGMLNQNYGSEDYWIFKTDSAGNLLWQKTFGSSSTDEVSSICLADNGGCLVAGCFSIINNMILTNRSYWVLKVDENGSLTWADTLGGSNYDLAYDIKALNNNRYVVFGLSSSSDGDVSNHHASTCGDLPDYWVVEILDSDTINYIYNNESNPESINIVPNPFSGSFKIIQPENFKDSDLFIYDLSGRQVYYSILDEEELSINTGKLKKGVYILRIINKDGSSIIKKIIKS